MFGKKERTKITFVFPLGKTSLEYEASLDGTGNPVPTIRLVVSKLRDQPKSKKHDADAD